MSQETLPRSPVDTQKELVHTTLVDTIERNKKRADDIRATSFAAGAAHEHISVEQYKEKMQHVVEKVIEASDCYVAVSPHVLSHVLRDGRFKSFFETNKTNGAPDRTYRSTWEEHMFGIAPNDTETPRPIYGYFSDHQNGIINSRGSIPPASRTALYGSVIVKIKRSSALRKATITFQDSLGSSAFPTPFCKPNYTSLALDTFKTPDILDHVHSSSKTSWGADYTEVQYHGGLTVDDIDSIHVSPHNTRYQSDINETKDIIRNHNAVTTNTPIPLIEF